LDKKAFRYVCSYCGLERFDNEWFIDNYIFGHKAYFDKGCIDMLNILNKKEREEREIREKMLISKCCNAIPMLPTHDNMGMCSKCKDNTEFYEEEDEE
tara:strand:- start:190 stop:483 length:294 start_codon:yes stop_codon:yes gene_type:complete